jgi:hypothetical protein
VLTNYRTSAWLVIFLATAACTEAGNGAGRPAPDGGAFVLVDSALHRIERDGACSWELPLSDMYVGEIVAESDGHVLMAAGHIDGYMSFGFGGWIEPGPAPGARTGFLTRLTPQGTLEWVRFLPGMTSTNVRGLNVDDAGYVYLPGYAHPVVDLGPPATQGSYPSGNFLAKFDAAGQRVWTALFDDSVVGTLDVGPTGPVLVTQTSIRGLAP